MHLNTYFTPYHATNLCFAIAACLLLILFSGQTPILEEKTASDLIHKGNSQWVAGYFDSAYVSYRMAQRLALQEADEKDLATALHLSGKYLTRNGRLDEAEATLDSAIAMSDLVGPLFPEIVLARCERSFVEIFRGNFLPAIERFEAIVLDCEALPPSEDSLRAKVYHRMGNVYAIHEQFPQALEYCSKALEIRKRILPANAIVIGHSENSLGAIKSWMDRYEESLAHYQRAVDILSKKLRPGHTALIQIKTNMAVLFEDLGLFWEALEMHRENLPFLDDLSPEAQYSTLFNYAATLSSVGDHDEALRYIDATEAYIKQYPDLRPETQALIYAERSRLYLAMEQYELAYTSIEEAIRETEQTLGPGSARLIGHYTRKGSLLAELGRDRESIHAFDTAMRIAGLYPESHAVSRGIALEFKGEVLIRQGNALSGLKSLKKALAIYRDSAPWHLPDGYSKLAAAWRSIGNWDSAFAMHHLAWKSVAPVLPFQLSPGPEIREYWTHTQLQPTLEEQGNSLLEYYAATKDPQFLEAGLATFEAALAVADSQRHYYESRTSKQLSRQYQLPVYETAIDMAAELFQLTGDTAFIRRSFGLAEKSKSGNLLDHLKGIQALHFAGVPDSLVERERYFRQRLASIDAARLDQATDRKRMADLKAEHLALKEAYRVFLLQLEETQPRYYQLKYPVLLDPHTLGTSLGDSQAMYSYFWGEQQLFVFCLFRGEWQMYRVARDSSLQKALDNWITFVSQPPDARGLEPVTFRAEGAQLSEALLPGLSPIMTQLLIIPDGELGYLPFESLLTNEVQDDDFRSWPYLGRTHGFLYAYSAELWVQQKVARQDLAASYRGFASDFQGESMVEIRADLGPLRYNREEVSQVADLLDGQALMGQLAREEAVKELGPDPLILHFATHALADEQHLMQSRLYFFSDSSGKEDGILHAYEIYGLTFNSPLTVLSACQTGKGRLLQGEGIMSLARAFQFSGSKRVLSTLWPTDDRAGATLVQAFFEKLASGTDITIALQQARLQWMEKSDSYHCHPYYWAGYVLIGDGGTVSIADSEDDSILWIWIPAAILLLLGLGGMRIWGNKQQGIS